MAELELELGPAPVHLYGAPTVGSDVLVVPVSGPVGPQGIPGAAGSGYTHTQASPSASWIVNHGLGVFPNVSVEVAGSQVIAEVIHSSVNTVNIVFASPQSGSARFA